MGRVQLFIFFVCVATAFEKVIGATEGGYHEANNAVEHKMEKRYTLGRVPLSYTQRRYGNDGFSIDKRYSGPSHFRELQARQTRRSDDDGQSYRNLLQYYGSGSGNDMDVDSIDPGAGRSPLIENGNDEVPLTDRELKTLLLLLEGYQDTPTPVNAYGAGGSGRNSNFYTPPPQYFTQEMLEASLQNPAMGMGKRETGKRMPVSKAQLGQEQPMSFENSLGAAADNYPMFLTQKRSKRIGAPPLKKKTSGMASVRIKKETDPKVQASLDEIFGSSNIGHDEGHGHQHSTSIPTTAISSSGQIPAPASSLQKSKPKKAINWSKHFGIDKRAEHQATDSAHSSSNGEGDDLGKTHESDSDNQDGQMDKNEGSDDKLKTNKHDDSNADATVSSTKANSLSSSSGTKRKADKLEKVKKDKAKEENDTEEKEDRKWILKEFYKNLAMSTNVKRKRESPINNEANKDDELGKLEKLERKMEEAGDQIIWDALKYTGAHRDVKLSPEELAQVKTEIIQKLAAAYSLEKIREAIDEFRQQLGELKDKEQQHY